MAHSASWASRLLRSERRHGVSAWTRTGVGGTGPPRGGHCPWGTLPVRAAIGGGEGTEPSTVAASRCGRCATGRCAQEVGRHGTVAGTRCDTAGHGPKSQVPGRGDRFETRCPRCEGPRSPPSAFSEQPSRVPRWRAGRARSPARRHRFPNSAGTDREPPQRGSGRAARPHRFHLCAAARARRDGPATPLPAAATWHSQRLRVPQLARNARRAPRRPCQTRGDSPSRQG